LVLPLIFPFFPYFSCPHPQTQGKGVGGARKKLDAAILEDRDKPYACDSEYPNLCDGVSGQVVLWGGIDS